MLDLNVKLKCGNLIKLIITCLSWHWIMSTNKENSQRKDVTKLENQVHKMSVIFLIRWNIFYVDSFLQEASVCASLKALIAWIVNTALRNFKGDHYFLSNFSFHILLVNEVRKWLFSIQFFWYLVKHNVIWSTI